MNPSPQRNSIGHSTMLISQSIHGRYSPSPSPTNSRSWCTLKSSISTTSNRLTHAFNKHLPHGTGRQEFYFWISLWRQKTWFYSTWFYQSGVYPTYTLNKVFFFLRSFFMSKLSIVGNVVCLLLLWNLEICSVRDVHINWSKNEEILLFTDR